MALFRRKTTTTDTSDGNSVPVDLQQYYSSGGSGVMKWIVRIVLFLLILAALVWGGIWLFNKLTNKTPEVNNPTSATSQQEAQKKTADAQAEAKKKTDEAAAKAKAAQDKAAADAKKAQEEANKKIAEAQQQANGGTATPTPAPAPAATPTPAPTAGGSGAGTGSTALPNTGPEIGLAAGLFAVVTVIGAAAHSLFMRRQVR
jgi:cytoskeletal protein RodZ